MQTERDQYADLEKPIEDVREMAQVVAQLAARVESGQVAWDPCLFAIYHLAELANTLHAHYHGDEAAVGGDKTRPRSRRCVSRKDPREDAPERIRFLGLMFQSVSHLNIV
jgi:hypothetical protein